MHEDWPFLGQAGAAVFSRPGLVEALLRGRPPIEVDGRVLDRRAQLLLTVVERAEVRRAATSGRGPFDPVAMRRELTFWARKVMPVRTDVYVTERVIPAVGDTPPIPVRIYRRFGAGVGVGPGIGDGRMGRRRPPAIVYYHGGGWVVGDLDSHDASCRLLAAVSGCLVVAVDYRLAPEHPFPAAVDDSLSAYQWVHRHADQLGFEPGQVGVMGDSAGGNLAAVVALKPARGWARAWRRRSHRSSSIPRSTRTSMRSPTGRWPSASCSPRSSWSSTGAATSPTLRTASRRRPRRCARPDHSGLAPALVVTAGFDPLRDDGEKYAEVLRAAGVEVGYRCYDDQIHGFMGMGINPVCLALATEIAEAAGRLMRRSAATTAS